VHEALILAERMSEKHTLYETGFLGAKIVIDGPRDSSTDGIVLRALGDIINLYDGSVFTGCDLNVSNENMVLLATATPFVLNSLSNPSIDTSSATGAGAFAAVRDVLDGLRQGGAAHIAIHGLGKVGSQISTHAMKHGCYVSGYDVDSSACARAGVSPVAETALFETPCDVLVLASISNLVTPEIARKIGAKWIVSAANAPFACDEVVDILTERGVKYLPDVVVNPGAVICDSIEVNCPDIYQGMSQDGVDEYVCRCVHSRVQDVLAYSKLFGVPPSEAVDLVLSKSDGLSLMNIGRCGRHLTGADCPTKPSVKRDSSSCKGMDRERIAV
jgi:leucine dehydrogenase